YVLGTERHESRRIDNQLKGRAGRQGDPGRSQFFISLEDDMFRRFAKDELEKMKKSLQVNEEGEVLNKEVHEFVNRVHRICEGSNFFVREYNLKLDDVLNEQRRTIYTLRNRILESNDMRSIVLSMLPTFIEREISEACPEDAIPEEWDVNRVIESIQIVTNVKIDLSYISDRSEVEQAAKTAVDAWNSYVQALEESEELDMVLKRVVLGLLDMYWTKHLENMELLKEGIGLRYYGQEDPMRQYAKEALQLFTTMYHQFERDACKQLAQLLKM
ncbi:MAG: accessory Sec system translocase SecA2, partial [Anoxybacillus gonensis]|nr:accessory Sec system translocase SecA2 [Anoxybacillus gonensis]